MCFSVDTGTLSGNVKEEKNTVFCLITFYECNKTLD